MENMSSFLEEMLGFVVAAEFEVFALEIVKTF
jgi:hypothetical protein